jgi:hypothetical protein
MVIVIKGLDDPLQNGEKRETQLQTVDQIIHTLGYERVPMDVEWYAGDDTDRIGVFIRGVEYPEDDSESDADVLADGSDGGGDSGGGGGGNASKPNQNSAVVDDSDVDDNDIDSDGRA